MHIKRLWTYHLLLAIFLFITFLIEEYIAGGGQGAMENFRPPNLWFLLTFFSISAATYLLNFKVVCPKYLKKNALYQFVLAVGVLILLFTGVRFLLEEVLVFRLTGFHNYYDYSRRVHYYVFDNSYNAIKPILYSTLLYVTINFIKAKAHERAELDLLKSQISPHFLFNTLNAFYVELIDDKPDTARDVHRLSELLRYVTYESQKDVVSLKGEIRFLRDYLHFYNKRFENNFSVDFKVTGAIGNGRIPSLILVHFVENLVKHGIVNDKDNPASIHIKIQPQYLLLNTENKILESKKLMESGIGTKNIRQRLSTLFGSDYELEYNNEPPYFKTYLKIPI